MSGYQLHWRGVCVVAFVVLYPLEMTNADFWHYGQNGFTALSVAARHNRMQAVQLLLQQKNVQVNTSDEVRNLYSISGVYDMILQSCYLFNDVAVRWFAVDLGCVLRTRRVVASCDGPPRHWLELHQQGALIGGLLLLKLWWWFRSWKLCLY